MRTDEPSTTEYQERRRYYEVAGAIPSRQSTSRTCRTSGAAGLSTPGRSGLAGGRKSALQHPGGPQSFGGSALPALTVSGRREGAAGRRGGCSPLAVRIALACAGGRVRLRGRACEHAAARRSPRGLERSCAALPSPKSLRGRATTATRAGPARWAGCTARLRRGSSAPTRSGLPTRGARSR